MRRKPTSADAVRTVNQIINATRNIGLEHGVHAINLKDVAEAVGVTRSTVYWYWSSAEELIDDVFARGVRYVVTYRGEMIGSYWSLAEAQAAVEAQPMISYVFQPTIVPQIIYEQRAEVGK